MWIGPLFEDDVDMEVARKQHDVYSQALWIIVSQCNLYAKFARRLLDDPEHQEWGTVDRFFDHRTLQHAHDLFAAAWRFRYDFRRLQLPFVDADQDRLDKVQALWLDWLRQEIETARRIRSLRRKALSSRNATNRSSRVVFALALPAAARRRRCSRATS